jgi:hypothetical protein
MGWQPFRDRDQGPSTPDEGVATDADAAFWASPVGRAARAKLRGDRFFQIELDDAALTAHAEAAVPSGGGRRARRTCDLLGQIEELGWHLEHVSWWRVEAEDTTGHLATGSDEPGSEQESEHLRGVYLFHAVEPPPAGESSPQDDVSEAHTPSHRRDVRVT